MREEGRRGRVREEGKSEGGGKEGKSGRSGKEWGKWGEMDEGNEQIIEEVKNTAQKWSMHVIIGRVGKVNQFG